jgi:hypothetical protein
MKNQTLIKDILSHVALHLFPAKRLTHFNGTDNIRRNDSGPIYSDPCPVQFFATNTGEVSSKLNCKKICCTEIMYELSLFKKTILFEILACNFPSHNKDLSLITGNLISVSALVIFISRFSYK